MTKPAGTRGDGHRITSGNGKIQPQLYHQPVLKIPRRLPGLTPAPGAGRRCCATTAAETKDAGTKGRVLNNAAIGGYAVPAPAGGVTLPGAGQRLFADVNRHPTIHNPLFAKERYKMAGTKTALTVDVNADHIGLISAAKEKYNIADEARWYASLWTTWLPTPASTTRCSRMCAACAASSPPAHAGLIWRRPGPAHCLRGAGRLLVLVSRPPYAAPPARPGSSRTRRSHRRSPCLRAARPTPCPGRWGCWRAPQ